MRLHNEMCTAIFVIKYYSDKLTPDGASVKICGQKRQISDQHQLTSCIKTSILNSKARIACFLAVLQSCCLAVLLSCFLAVLFSCCLAFLLSHCLTVLLCCLSVLLSWYLASFLLSCVPTFLRSCFAVLLSCSPATLLSCIRYEMSTLINRDLCANLSHNAIFFFIYRFILFIHSSIHSFISIIAISLCKQVTENALACLLSSKFSVFRS